MTYYIANKYRVFMAEEDSYGQFNTDSNDYQELRPEADKFEHKGKSEVLNRKLMRADLLPSKSVVGTKTSSLSFLIPARSGGEAADDGAFSTLPKELAIPLKCSFGNMNFNRGCCCGAGQPTYAGIDCADPDNDFSVGSLVFIDPTGSGTYYPRWISGIDSENNRLYFSGDWKGGDLWNLPINTTSNGMLCTTCQLLPANKINSSGSVEISGIAIDSTSPVWKYTGLVGNFKISDASAKKRVMLGFDFTGDSFDTSETTPAISIATGADSWPVSPTDLKSLSADLRINAVKTAYSYFNFDCGNSYSEILNANKENGRDGYALTSIEPKGNLVIYWDRQIQQKLSSGETIDVSWIVGSVDNGIGMHAPNCEIREIKESETNGLLTMEISFVVLPSELPDVPAYSINFCGRNL